MKLITLNIWGGHVYEPLLKFIQLHQNIDIFCLQEVYHNAEETISTEDRQVTLNIFSELQNLLPDHQGFFRPTVANIYGIGMFVNKKVKVLNEGEIIIHNNPHYLGSGPRHSRNLQWLECMQDEQKYSIINVHGLWNGMGKNDCPERLAQSEKIKNFISKLNMPKILCGDFNLRPDTQSIKIIEEGGMNNLIRQYDVTSTRTNLYPKNEKFADYIFTSPEIKIKHFEVLACEVSDHAPLLLEFY